MNVSVPTPAVTTQNKPLQQSPNPGTGTEAKGEAVKDRATEFKSYYEKYRNSSGVEEQAKKNVDTDTVDEVSDKKITDVESKTDPYRGELDTPESLLVLLLNLYAQKGGINVPESISNIPGSSASELHIKIQGGNLQEVIKKLMENKDLPSDLGKILQQYNELFTGALSSNNTSTSLLSVLSKDAVKGLSTKTLKLEQASSLLETDSGSGITSKADDLSVFKNNVIDQIKSLLEETQDNAAIKRNITGIISDNSLDLLRKPATVTKDRIPGASVEAVTLQGNVADKPQANEVGTVKNTLVSDKKDDDKFLESILKENGTQKPENRLNMLMNHLNNSKSGNFETIKQEGQVVANRTNFANDLFKAVKFMDTNELKELKVNINPRDLGQLVISVTMESGKMKASISASNKEAYNLLTANLNDIKNSLSNSDIRIQDLSIGIYNGDTTFFKDGSQDQRNQEQGSSFNRSRNESDSEQELIVETPRYSKDDSQVNMLA